MSLSLVGRLALLRSERREAEAEAEERRERRARIRRFLGPYPVGYAGQDRRLRRGAQGRNDSEWQGETVETSPCIEDSKLC